MTHNKIVILIGSNDLQHRFVARSLAELPNASIVIAQQPRPSLLKHIVRTCKRFGITVTVSRVLLSVVLGATGETSRRKADLVRVLGDPKFPENVSVIKTVGVNSAQTQKLLRQLNPSVLCIYGTYIVSDATLSIAPLALNLHTGISPRYRGADCAFWPLHREEPDWLGATVHQCTSDVDGGSIYGIAIAKLETEDGVGAVFGRCVIAGSDLYQRVVHDLITARKIEVVSQDLSDGKEYTVAMRGWFAEFRVARLIRRGLIPRYLGDNSTN